MNSAQTRGPAARLMRRLIPEDSLFRNRSFVLVWLSATLAMLGGSVSQLALPLTAVQNLHASATEMGLMLASATLPFVLFSLPAGVWIDRCKKRTLIIAFNLLGTLALFGVPLAAHFGFLSMPLLYLAEFAVGTCWCIGGSAEQVFVTAVVGRDRLIEANSKQAAAGSIAGLLGPILAGVLVAWLGAPTAVALDGLMFLISALLVAAIRLSETPAPATGVPILRDAISGLRYIWHHPLLRAFAIMAAMCLFLFDGFMALYVLHATRSLHLTAGELATVNTLAALGALLSATLVPHLNKRIGKYVVIPLGLLATAAGFVGYALVPAGAASLALAGAAMFLVEAGMTAYTINYLALRQLATPDDLLGRMTTTMRFLSVSAAPIGASVAGFCGDHIGLPPVLATLGFGGICAAFIAHTLIRRALDQGAGAGNTAPPDASSTAGQPQEIA